MADSHTEVAHFTLEKATKNTYRYQEEPSPGRPPVIRTLYIQKWVLGNPPPEEIEVAVTWRR